MMQGNFEEINNYTERAETLVLMGNNSAKRIRKLFAKLPPEACKEFKLSLFPKEGSDYPFVAGAIWRSETCPITTRETNFI